jgi:hypothetical protein
VSLCAMFFFMCHTVDGEKGWGGGELHYFFVVFSFVESCYSPSVIYGPVYPYCEQHMYDEP